MRRRRFATALFCSALACWVLLASGTYAWGQSDSCSNGTLRGDYAFTIQGDLLVPNQIPVRGVAMTNFDGEGNLTQIDHVLVNGIPPATDWRPGAGTYSVNPDCTGMAEINIQGRPPLHLFFVLTGKGKEIHMVVSDPGAASFSVGVRR